MDKVLLRRALLIVAVVFGGCSRPETPEDDDDQVQNGVVGSNSLAPNSLAPNSLAPNSLAPNSLAPNSLAPNALAPDALTDAAMGPLTDPGEDGDRARMLVRYLVGCALPAGEVFPFAWTDGGGLLHEEAYPGQLGLAPGWRTGPLDSASRAMVSACIAARTNYYGVQVELSLRAAEGPLSAVDPAEMKAFSKLEGAFWGDLFDASGAGLRACFTAANKEGSRKWLRECAAGHVEPGGSVVACEHITVVGACEDLCDAPTASAPYYTRCQDPAQGEVTRLITTALPSPPTPLATGALVVTTSTPAEAIAGACRTVSQTITVTNRSLLPASSLIVTHALGDGLAFVSATTGDGQCTAAGGAVTCALQTLAGGRSATISVVSTPTRSNGSAVTSTFAVSAAGERDITDNVSVAKIAVTAPAASAWETISSDFNNAPIAKGQTIWFSLAMKPGPLPWGVTTIRAHGGALRFTAAGMTYTLPLPAAKVALDAAAKVASSTYDAALARWSLVTPRTFAGRVLVSGVPFVAPVDLPGGIKHVTATVHFSADRVGVKPKWSWSAAVYDSFSRDPRLLGAQPTDDASKNPSQNADRAGTPEAWKPFIAPGAKGSGDKNYTGASSSAKDGVAELTASCP